MLECWPHQDYVYITTDELFGFHNDELDGMPCKLDSTENLRSFEITQNNQTHMRGVVEDPKPSTLRDKARRLFVINKHFYHQIR